MVLDSPYRSLKSLVNDNVERFLKNSFLATLSKGPATALFKNYLLKSKIKYDLEVNQNKHLLPIIGSSCFFIISDQDEMIPYRRFQKTIKEYRPKGTKSGNYASLNAKTKHGAARDEKLIRKIFEFVKNKFTLELAFKYAVRFNEEYQKRSDKNQKLGITRRETVNTQVEGGRKKKKRPLEMKETIVEMDEEVKPGGRQGEGLIDSPPDSAAQDPGAGSQEQVRRLSAKEQKQVQEAAARGGPASHLMERIRAGRSESSRKKRPTTRNWIRRRSCFETPGCSISRGRSNPRAPRPRRRAARGSPTETPRTI